MNEQFVIVAKVGTAKRLDFFYATDERGAIKRIANEASVDAEIQRVFKFDEYGHVTHYFLKVKGFKLSLEAIPEEGK